MAAISFSEHYGGRYKRYIHERRLAGSQPIAMFEMLQPAGDFSDPAVSDLVIIETRSSMRGSWNLGAGRIRAAEAGLINVVPPDCPTDIVIDHPHHFRIFSVAPQRISLQLDDHCVAAAPDFARLQHRGTRNILIAQLLRRLWAAGTENGANGRLFADSLWVTLAAEIWREAGQTVTPARGGLSPLQLKRAQEFVEAALDREFSLADLAATAGLSAFHFSRSFKHATGLSPFQYLAKRRIARGQALLATTVQPLVEISLQCGFADQSSFITAFKRDTGFTPARWRREVAMTTTALPRDGPAPT